MNLPAFITADKDTLALIVRSKLANELPQASFDDAWDAILAEGGVYEPSKEVEEWMRSNWNSVAFGAPLQPDSPVELGISEISVGSHALARTWMRPFLDIFIEGGIATDACRECIPGGIDITTPDKAEKRDPVFAEAYASARKIVADKWRKAGKQRAIDGVLEPIIGRVARDQDGQLTDDEGNPLFKRVYSDSILNRGLAAYCSEFKTGEGTTINNNVSATASAKSETAVVVTKEKAERIHARTKKKLAHQVDRARERGQLLPKE